MPPQNGQTVPLTPDNYLPPKTQPGRSHVVSFSTVPTVQNRVTRVDLFEFWFNYSYCFHTDRLSLSG